MLLGEFLAFRHSMNVLLIDMDAQANLSYCMVPPHQIENQTRERRTAYHLLRAGFESGDLDIGDYITYPPLVVSNIARSGMRTHGTNIHMVVSTPDVAQLDEDLMNRWEAGERMPLEVRQTLHRALEPALDRYDYILIDCPPGLSLFSTAALVASDYYVSPIIPEPLSLQGVDLVQRRQGHLAQRYGVKAEFKGLIVNVVKHFRYIHSRVSEEVYSNSTEPDTPFEYWLPANERLRTVGEYDPDVKGKWAMGSDEKFSDIHHKYGLSYKLTNPSEGSLNRQRSEGPKCCLEDRIANFVSEFTERCPPG